MMFVIGPGKEHVVLQKGEVITNESFDSEQIPELKIDFDGNIVLCSFYLIL